MNNSFEYDVTLSFAGEDRDFVDCVAGLLKKSGLKVFYDRYEQISLWGKDLYTHLDDVYTNKARFCVMFISSHYAKKLWTNHEMKSAQARAFTNSEEYILPFRLDDTVIPGIRQTVGYLSIKGYDCQQLAQAIAEKIIGDKKNIENADDNNNAKDDNEETLEYGISKIGDGKYEIKIRQYDFFSGRLSKAFPGVRGLRWFSEPKEIIERLKLLLAKPLSFNKYPDGNFMKGGIATPIWWFRGGASMPIKEFEVLSETRCRFGSNELEIDKVAVYRCSRPYKEFIYLKTKGVPALEDSEETALSIAAQLSYRKYASENYALYRGEIIKDEEREDGAMFRDGKIIYFEERPVARTRFLTPYNIIICAQSSTYNSSQADRFFAPLLDDWLTKDEELEKIIPLLEAMENDSHLMIEFF